MRTAEETQKLVNAAKLEDKLRQPGNQLNAVRLLQALTVKEVFEAKRQLDLIEERFCKLQEANAAEGVRSEGLEKQIVEIRRDKEMLRSFLSEAEAATRNIKDGLESLRSKVSDECFKFTADNVRFGKDIKTLSKQIDRDHEKLGRVEEDLENVRASLPKTQDLAALNDTLARLEPMVKSMYDKLDRVATLTFREKQALTDAISEQAHVRNFLDAFIPKQDDFFQFLNKLHEANSQAAVSSESLLNGAVNEASFAQLSHPLPPPSSGLPQPPLKATQMLEQYNHFSSSYRIKRPKSEARFVRQFLKKLDPRAAAYMQRKLRQEYPDLARLLPRAETSPKTAVVFSVDVGNLRWEHVKTVMRRIDGKELFSLLEAD
ncbi:uncharacterized protein F4812DRAFT_420940 [Daldinia caldariorum]|uniref:uncharacterized protein n=1 Tax=Daldinia caldariorum TaxID=326644 RepID=UPI0020082BC2|nr:uncharacterized protein F4812DRAFT_420940 [Daldinia caldariorum]KAI1469940.1 hypothetical protein F4812DRAFT_420940 [Daldinia caldariorum]